MNADGIDQHLLTRTFGQFFVGLFFLYAMSSGFFRGVGRDAEYVVKDIAPGGAETFPNGTLGLTESVSRTHGTPSTIR